MRVNSYDRIPYITEEEFETMYTPLYISVYSTKFDPEREERYLRWLLGEVDLTGPPDRDK